MVKYYQITVYLEQVTDQTNHKGELKLKKFTNNYLIKVNEDQSLTASTANRDMADDALKNFLSSSLWTSLKLTTTLDGTEESLPASAHTSDVGNYFKREITNIKELPITGDYGFY